jgi:hypothetical protein
VVVVVPFLVADVPVTTVSSPLRPEVISTYDDVTSPIWTDLTVTVPSELTIRTV